MEAREHVVKQIADGAAEGFDVVMSSIVMMARMCGASGPEYATAMHIALTEMLFRVLLMSKDPEKFIGTFLKTTNEAVEGALKMYLNAQKDKPDVSKFNVDELLKNLKPKGQ